MLTQHVGRNETCPCGSGKKYKKCCLLRQSRAPAPTNGIGLRPQSGGHSPTFWSHPPEQPDAPPPPNGEWVEWVFVKGKGWTHESEVQPGDQYQLKDGSWGTYQPEEIEATGGHPFWVISGEDLDQRPVPQHCPAEVPNSALPGRWVNAVDLRVGDILFTRDGRQVPVTNVSVRQVQTKVYNLQVAELENYAVGYTGILVHNSSGVPQPQNVPNLAGMSRADAHIAIRQAGYNYHGTSAGGYVRYRHPSGAEIQIRPNGEIIRLGPPVTPQSGGRPYHPRIDHQGNTLPTHSTSEFVPPLPGRGSP